MYDERIHYAHFIILLAWILPEMSFFDVPQFISPFIATVIFIVIDVCKSRGYYPYNDMVPLIGGLNLVGMIFATVEFVLQCYQGAKKYENFQMGFSIKMFGYMDGAFIVLMVVAILIGYVALFVKKKVAAKWKI